MQTQLQASEIQVETQTLPSYDKVYYTMFCTTNTTRKDYWF